MIKDNQSYKSILILTTVKNNLLKSADVFYSFGCLLPIVTDYIKSSFKCQGLIGSTHSQASIKWHIDFEN